MGVLDPRSPVSEIDRLAGELAELKRRLDLLEAPSGTSAFQAVAKLTALVADIQAQLDIYNASRYTNSEIDARDAIVNANIGTSITAALAGDVSIGGFLFAPAGYSYDITYTRRAAWLGNDGRLAWASSSERKKTAISPADPTRLARILDVVPMSFFYRAEVARRTQLRIEQGIDYMPKRELGLMAEHLHAAGLTEFVNYDEVTGEPEGIEYSMLVVALLSVVRDHDTRLQALEALLG